MNVPDDLSYTADHEWVRAEGSLFRVGITDFAQDALGDVVFVDLPEVGSEIERGGPLGEVESTKSVSQIYAPLSGRVTEVNDQLRETPEDLNSEPYGKGWLAVLEASVAEEVSDLLDAAGYRQITEP